MPTIKKTNAHIWLILISCDVCIQFMYDGEKNERKKWNKKRQAVDRNEKPPRDLGERPSPKHTHSKMHTNNALPLVWLKWRKNKNVHFNI